MVQVPDSRSSPTSRGLLSAVMFRVISVLVEQFSCVFQIFASFTCGAKRGKEVNRVTVTASHRD